MTMNGLNFDSVYALCNRMGYFTYGCTHNYDRMFELVRNGASREVIAAAIWVNSDDDSDIEEIKKQLDEIAEGKR